MAHAGEDVQYFYYWQANPRPSRSMTLYFPDTFKATSALSHKHFYLNSCVDLHLMWDHKFIGFHLIDWWELLLKTKLTNVWYTVTNVFSVATPVWNCFFFLFFYYCCRNCLKMTSLFWVLRQKKLRPHIIYFFMNLLNQLNLSLQSLCDYGHAGIWIIYDKRAS